MPGFTRGRKLDKVGQDESDTAELFFSDLRVPMTNVVGEVDRGFIHMMERLVQDLLFLARAAPASCQIDRGGNNGTVCVRLALGH